MKNNKIDLFQLQDNFEDVLLKQDVDLGFSLILPDATTTTTTKATSVHPGKAQAAAKVAAENQKKPFCSSAGASNIDIEDDIQKLNALLEIKSDEV